MQSKHFNLCAIPLVPRAELEDESELAISQRMPAVTGMGRTEAGILHIDFTPLDNDNQISDLQIQSTVCFLLY